MIRRMTYFHSHLRENTRTSSLQSSCVQWNLPSAPLTASLSGLAMGLTRVGGGESMLGERSLSSGRGSSVGACKEASMGEGNV